MMFSLRTATAETAKLFRAKPPARLGCLSQTQLQTNLALLPRSQRPFTRSAVTSKKKTQTTATTSSSASAFGPIGVTAALEAEKNPSFKIQPSLFKEFDLTGRVAVVSGGNRGLGLEMAEALCEAGAKVYCLDLPSEPGKEWTATRNFVEKMSLEKAGLEYRSVDVTDQQAVWNVVEKIADDEKRMDVCVAAAGILAGADCLEYPSEEFKKIMNVNVNGVLHTAQAAGRQMRRFGTPGSIILIASMSGSITNKDHAWVGYNTSKSAVLQMTRSMACELGPERIRVNSLSPGHIYTSMTAAYLDKYPELYEKWSSLNPLGRLGRPDELRGAVAWLASDASTFCTGSDILVSGGHHAW